MKNIFLLAISLIVLNISSYCQKDTASKKAEPNIKQFWLVVLKTGPMDKEITDSVKRFLPAISLIWKDCTMKAS